MTTMYIISAIILAIVVTTVIFVFIGKIEHKNRKLNLNWLLLMATIILSCSLAMVIIYHSQNDLTEDNLSIAYENGYEAGHSDGLAETRIPTNEEMEEWFSNTQEVVVGINEGGDLAVHIIDQRGDEWVLFADEVVTK